MIKKGFYMFECTKMINKLYIISTLFILGLSGCSTLKHHEIGDYYSGVNNFDKSYSNNDNDNEISSSPSGYGLAGVLPSGDSFEMYVTFPIDIIASGIVDTLLLPVDAIFHSNSQKKHEYDNAVKNKNLSYALKYYQENDEKYNQNLITLVLSDQPLTSDILKDKNKKDAFGYTALSYALVENKKEKVKVLIENVDIKDIPIHKLLESGLNNEMFKYLLDMNLDVYSKDALGNDILYSAIMGGDIKNINFLIDKGFDINAKNNNTHTALMMAAKNKNINAVKTLILLNCDLNEKDEKRETAMLYAVDSRNIEIVKLIVEAGGHVNNINYIQHTALMRAINNKDTEMSLVLIDIMDDLDGRSYDGETALFYAYNSSVDEKIFSKLLNSKLDINAVNNKKQNILFEYPYSVNAFFKDRSRFKALIKAGVNMEQIDENGETPLMYHKRKGHEEEVTILTNAKRKKI